MISQKLKSGNLKVTPQRMAIYKLLCETTEHPTAEIIYNNLKEAYPTMSLATVYKTLISLKKAKLIQELNLNDSSCHYDADVSFHSHLVCTCCNKVYDYNFNFNSDVFLDISKDLDFDVDYSQIYFYGKCKNCQN